MAQVFAVVALAQFGNLYVDWTKKGEGGAPDDPDAPTPRVTAKAEAAARPSFVPDADTRRTNLVELSQPALVELASGLALECLSCTTQSHWVSRIRHGILDASTKALKTAITARGVACRTCSQREHFVDRLLDVVHLPVL
jgi:hypothetical protein